MAHALREKVGTTLQSSGWCFGVGVGVVYGYSWFEFIEGISSSGPRYSIWYQLRPLHCSHKTIPDSC